MGIEKIPIVSGEECVRGVMVINRLPVSGGEGHRPMPRGSLPRTCGCVSTWASQVMGPLCGSLWKVRGQDESLFCEGWVIDK